MPNLGELRRSAIVSTFGPGAVVDFRADGGAVSAVAACLEEWDRCSPPAGLANPQTVFEARLQKKLGVSGFRLPPIAKDERDTTALLGVRFPKWLQCPQCHHLKPARTWNVVPGHASRYCGTCTAAAPGQQKVYVVPVRFVIACEKGHLDDFPWNFWVKHLPHCQNMVELILEPRGAGLAGLTLTCPRCLQSRTLDGIFGRDALKDFPCTGKQPWLDSRERSCGKQPRVLQRGASNLYFPVVHSALDIPPWSDQLQKILGQYWDPILKVDEGQRIQFIAMLKQSVLGHLSLSAEQLAATINERSRLLERPEAANLRLDEYRQFTSEAPIPLEQDTEFEIRGETVPNIVRAYIRRLVRAVRLREVRALSGFTRIEPPPTPEGETSSEVAKISRSRLNWLPAIEVRGEGIFLELEHDAVVRWAMQDTVQSRASIVQQRYVEGWRARFGRQSSPPRHITPQFILIHTFAHALMRQLSLECGYSTSSLRERLYVDDAAEMLGLLIYTSTTDSDGTLGGLSRQGLPDRIQSVIPASIESLHWCSSDPLCVKGLMSLAEANNMAACHACVLAPETSCEEYNSFLDRALLVGLPEDKPVGFFSSLV
jgi:Domain of unknown function (DUF1998)